MQVFDADILDAASDVVFTGAAGTFKAPLEYDLNSRKYSFEMRPVPPGTYTVTVEHSRYNFATSSGSPLTITVEPFNWPGQVPLRIPSGGGAAFAMMRHPLSAFTFDTLTIRDKDAATDIDIYSHRWCPQPGCDPARYNYVSGGRTGFIEWNDRPGKIYAPAGNAMPVAGCTIHVAAGNDQWAAFPCGQTEYNVYIGGPDNNVSAGAPPGMGPNYLVRFHAYLFDGTKVDGLPLSVSPPYPAQTVLTGTVAAFNFSSSMNGAAIADSRWTITRRHCGPSPTPDADILCLLDIKRQARSGPRPGDRLPELAEALLAHAAPEYAL